ncbi:MAG: formate dehydrogenase accessory protein FdhE [Anaerolineae bacterium]
MSVDEAVKALEELGRGRPDLREAALVQRDIMLCQFQPPAPASLWLPDADEVRARVASGIPLLPGHEAAFDLSHAESVFHALLKLVEGRRETKAQARAIQQAARGAAGARGWLLTALAGDSGVLLAEAKDLQAPLLPSLLNWSIAPTLQAWVAAAEPQLDLDRWQMGHCPFCGEWPGLGEWRGVELNRRLRCGLCGGDWCTQRLRCPFCETTDTGLLGYFSAEGDARWRVETCDNCGGYVKTETTFSALPTLLLPVENLRSLYLDVLAAARGLQRPAVRSKAWQSGSPSLILGEGNRG